MAAGVALAPWPPLGSILAVLAVHLAASCRIGAPGLDSAFASAALPDSDSDSYSDSDSGTGFDSGSDSDFDSDSDSAS